MTPLHHPPHQPTPPRRHPLRRGQVGSGAGQRRIGYQRRGVALPQIGDWDRKLQLPLAANDNRPTLAWRLSRLCARAGIAAVFGTVVMLFDA